MSVREVLERTGWLEELRQLASGLDALERAVAPTAPTAGPARIETEVEREPSLRS